MSRQHPSQQDHGPFYASDATLSFTTNREEPIYRNSHLWPDLEKQREKSDIYPDEPVLNGPALREIAADDDKMRWRTASTEQSSTERELDLRAINDVYFGLIIDCSFSDRMQGSLTVNALNGELSRSRDTAGCIVHSDHGSQLRQLQFVHALNLHHLISSMGTFGADMGNGAMEPFLALLYKYILDRKRWQDREGLRVSIITWIERTYH